MKIVVNPEYKKAPYELRFTDVHSSHQLGNHRFNEIPPSYIQKDHKQLSEWIMTHTIPPVIQLED